MHGVHPLQVAAVEAERLAVKCKAIDWGRVLEPPAPDCTALQIQSVGGKCPAHVSTSNSSWIC